MAEVELICRVCLQPSLEFVDLETPFPANDGGAEGFTYLRCFQLVTHIKDVNSNENFCDSCANELKITYEFLEKAKEADNVLQEFKKSKEQHDIEAEKLAMDLEDSYDGETNTYEEHLLEPNEDDEAETVEKSNLELLQTDVITEPDNEPNAFGEHLVEPNEEERYAENALKMSKLDDFNYDDYDDAPVDTINDNAISDTAYLDATEDFDAPLTSEEFTLEEDDEGRVDDPAQPSNATFKCYECNAVFASLPLRRRHQWRCHKTMTTCRICLVDVPINQSMRHHMIRKHMHLRKCQHCGFVGRDHKVVVHERIVHETDIQYQCQLCGKSFSYLSYTSHLRTNCRRMQACKSDACKICGKVFVNNTYLREHMSVHAKNRKVFTCDQCDRTYLTQQSLEVHRRIHKGNVAKCTVCSKEFPRPYELRVHMRFHTGECPYECEVCHKRFAIKSHLRSHVWRHNGIKVKCDLCDKLFNSTKALHEHSFTHTGMPYPCAYCERGFPSKQKIRNHLHAVHNVDMDYTELEQLTKGATQTARRTTVTLVEAINGDGQVDTMQDNELSAMVGGNHTDEENM